MSTPFEKIVPAYPYEGALFYLLDGKYSASPYYPGLYGPEGRLLKSRAAALACLFEEIVLSSADIGLPDVHGHMQSERVYTHPGLRLSMDWRTGEWSPEYEDVARRLRDRGLVDGLLKKHGHLFDSDFAVKQFLCRLALQVRVALENEAILLGGQTFREFYDASISVIGKCFGMSTSDADGLLLTFKSKDLDILGLDFSPSDLDGFVEIRAESTIRAYGTEWR